MHDRLYRSRDDRMLFGVAGGMARYMNLDPSIVRLVWVLLFLAVGAGVLLYIVAAIVIPEEPAGSVPPASSGVAGSAAAGASSTARGQREVRDNAGAPIFIGLVLVVVGAWFLAQRFLPELDGRVVWPAVLVVLGLALVLGALRGRGQRS